MRKSFPAFAFSADSRVVALRGLYPMVSDDAGWVEMHLAYEGEWHGHPQGSFEFTREVFENIVANFERQANPVLVDYEHASEWAAEAPAAGWIHKVEVRDDDEGKAHLWAKAELTAKGADHVAAGEYRFSSVVVDFEATDRKSGEDIGAYLKSVAFTGIPYIDSQEPMQAPVPRAAIQLSQRRAALAYKKDQLLMTVSKEDFIAKLQELDADELTAEQLKKLCEAMGMMAEAESGEEPEAELSDDEEEEELPMSDEGEGEKPLSDEEDEEEKELSDGDEEEEKELALDDPAADAAMAALAPLMEATGMDAAGLAAAIQERLDDVVAALQGSLEEPASEAPLSDDAPSSVELKAHATTIAMLSQRAEKAESALLEYRTREAEADVDALIDEGKILDAGREDMLALRLSDKASFERLKGALVPQVPTGLHASSTEPSPESSLIDEEDQFVIAHRKMLSRTRLSQADQDRAIRLALKNRRHAEN